MERKNYIVAVDLGSSNVVAAVGERGAGAELEVVCVVSKPVEGVHAGRIENIESVSSAIGEAFGEIERRAGIRVTEAYAGISGEFVRCARHTDHVYVFDPQNGVNRKDVEALFDRMRNVQAPDDETIMERVPQNYMIDDAQEVKNPVGSFGKKLSSTFNFILCLRTPMQRLDMALRRVGVKMLAVVSDALATPEAVLSPEEKEEGVAVVDLGGGVTDVTVYYRNVVRYIASIPMGASAINRDIRTMSVPEKHVESLKCKYGSAVADLAPEDKLIRVNGRTSRDAKDILLRNLATVVEARVTDIAEFVLQELRDSGYADKLAFGIVLTGGSANLKDIDELFRRVTKMEVRIGVPDTGIDEASREKVADPVYAPAIGILLKGAELGACAVVERPATAARAEEAQPERPAEARRPFAPAEPAGRMPEFRHVPPRSPQPSQFAQPSQPAQFAQPAQQPVGEPMPEPDAAPQQTVRDEEEAPAEPRRRRDWGSIFQKTFDKINRGFSAAEDEEI